MANNGSNTVSVLLGNGDGTFQPKVDYETGTYPTSVAVGDFNGDGRADLAVANSVSNNVSVLLGNGNGTFQAKVDYGVGTNPTSVAVADFNGDGKADLAVASGSNNVSVLLGNGNGTFQPKVDYETGTYPTSVAVGDFNGDGRADLVVANYSSKSVSVLLGNGDGTFRPKADFGTGTNPTSVALADFNGDGKADLAVANSGSNNVSVLLGNGDGTFQPKVDYGTGTYPTSVAVGDFNGDGRADLVVANWWTNSNSVSVLIGNGDGTFQSRADYSTGLKPSSVAVADFDGDGRPDLAVATSSTVSVLLNNGKGEFPTKADYSAGTDAISVAVGDFNGDGRADLVVANSRSDNLSVRLGNGNGTFQPKVDYNLGLFQQSVVVGDFNGDGKIDLAVASNKVSVLLALLDKSTCTYVLSSGGQTIRGQVFPATGGTGSITITTAPGCPRAVGTLPRWVILTNPSSGTGSGTITFQVLPNSGGDISSSFTVAGVPFTIEQQAASIPGLSFLGSMAHLAGEENWTTTFTLVNKSGATAQTRLSLFGDALDPSGNGPLLLPLVFPQQAAASGPLLAASFDRTLGANASLIVTSAGPQTPPVLVGSAQLAATGPVDGFAIFHQIVTTQEAVVPMETRNAGSYLLAFDNTNGLVLGVAVQNVSSQNAIIPVLIRDDSGVQISAPGATIALGGNGHTAFVLSDPVQGFPVTANKRGTIEFDTPTGGQISVLGIRFTPLGSGNALTTISALANVGTGGGSIAHLASGGDGWQTTFVLVNTGTSAAPATLSFFADATGSPLSLPLSFPQSGDDTTTMVVPSYTQLLAAGATLLIQSSGAADLLTGSAQLTTTGHVSGFVIFRHNNQEAVVPLESRNSNAYILAFDNTNGTATGVAINAVSTQQVTVPVTVRDDTGATIATDMITLAPNGHTQFTLVFDKYPATANIRGTIEFDRPSGAQIGALGIRIPTGAAHTYTTLPALAK